MSKAPPCWRALPVRRSAEVGRAGVFEAGSEPGVVAMTHAIVWEYVGCVQGHLVPAREA